jgi:glycosyltransferase involved in cell wall biosynthesis
MEAMAYQLPVIGTALGGTIDQIEEGKTGFLVPPSNPDVLALKIKTLLHLKSLRNSMGHAGRQRVRAHFSMDAFFQKLTALYESILYPKC